MQSWQRLATSPEETASYGRLIGQVAGPGTVVLLEGQLGAGKTVLARGIADGLGIHQVVRSPSFSLLHLYEGRLPFYHLDLYRLAAPEELSE
ncbi:MAG: tRNA (adenosine(37)-N6)-threonylcarbamoyltransferase complex ATPase subunit type 1 TsaE, partial [Bacillota bacterium]|nr:tRNA (adenosine(37)-N6)-threonylcarbamoyltransferase complex ATPase subunit type 1 TsaE [Bacillota bacterium]